MITVNQLNLRQLRGQSLLGTLELRDLHLGNTELQDEENPLLSLWHAHPRTLEDVQTQLKAHAPLEPHQAADQTMLRRAAEAAITAAEPMSNPPDEPLCPAALWTLMRASLILRAAEGWRQGPEDLPALGAMMRREATALTSADFQGGLQLITHACPAGGEDDGLLLMTLLASGAEENVTDPDERELHASATGYLKNQLDDACLYGSLEALARSNPELKERLEDHPDDHEENEHDNQH